MKAVILAGGRGTRLAPYTTIFPKPLLPVGNIPILEIIIRQLVHHNFKDITLSLGYLSEMINIYLQNNHNFGNGVKLSQVKEEFPLGTAGALALIPKPKETFLVMNGDILTTLNYSKLIKFHKEKGAQLTIATSIKKIKLELGLLEVKEDFTVTDYNEKPTMEFFDSMGIYIYEPTILSYIEYGKYLDLPTLVLRLIENGERVLSYQHDEPHFWLDMGSYGDYERANKEFEKRRNEFLPDVKG